MVDKLAYEQGRPVVDRSPETILPNEKVYIVEN